MVISVTASDKEDIFNYTYRVNVSLSSSHLYDQGYQLNRTMERKARGCACEKMTKYKHRYHGNMYKWSISDNYTDTSSYIFTSMKLYCVTRLHIKVRYLHHPKYQPLDKLYR